MKQVEDFKKFIQDLRRKQAELTAELAEVNHMLAGFGEALNITSSNLETKHVRSRKKKSDSLPSVVEAIINKASLPLCASDIFKILVLEGKLQNSKSNYNHTSSSLFYLVCCARVRRFKQDGRFFYQKNGESK